MTEEIKPDQVAAEVAPMNTEQSNDSATWEASGEFEPRSSKTRPAYMLTVNLIETYKHINKVSFCCDSNRYHHVIHLTNLFLFL